VIPVLCWFSGIGAVLRRFFGLPGQRPAHRGALMVKMGLTFYDVFTWGSRVMPFHRFTLRSRSLAKRPALTPQLKCTAKYYDAWVSYPERLCLEVLMDAAALHPGTAALNYVSLHGASGGAVLLRDELTGEDIEVRPQLVVNATGAWIDCANRRIGHETQLIGGTKGAHLVLDNPALFEALQGEMIYYENDDGRAAVTLPWLGKVLAGTTDIRVEDPDQARCEEDEVEYILAGLHEILPGVQVDRTHIVSHFSGVRPLPWSDAETPGAVSRDHHCALTEPSEAAPFPVFSLIGGKWTTFRAFAEHVGDKVLARLGMGRRAESQGMAIGGGKDYPRSEEAKEAWLAALEERSHVPAERLAVLLQRYGTRAEQVATFIAEGPDEPLRHLASYSRREAAFIVLHEDVCHLDDLVLRRSAMALLGEVTQPLLEELADLVAPLLDWDAGRRPEELARTASILAERFGVHV